MLWAFGERTRSEMAASDVLLFLFGIESDGGLRLFFETVGKGGGEWSGRENGWVSYCLEGWGDLDICLSICRTATTEAGLG